MGLVVARVLDIAAQLVTVGAARGFVVRPGRLPGCEENPAGLAHLGPVCVIARLGGAQIDALSVDAPHPLVVLPHQCHGLRSLPEMPPARHAPPWARWPPRRRDPQELAPPAPGFPQL